VLVFAIQINTAKDSVKLCAIQFTIKEGLVFVNHYHGNTTMLVLCYLFISLTTMLVFAIQFTNVE
jgi:hypothetical protein